MEETAAVTVNGHSSSSGKKKQKKKRNSKGQASLGENSVDKLHIAAAFPTLFPEPYMSRTLQRGVLFYSEGPFQRSHCTWYNREGCCSMVWILVV